METVKTGEQIMAMPKIDSRWKRGKPFNPELGKFNGYTVKSITNLAHKSDKHPPQVIYQGDNGNVWSLPLDKWPGNLIPATRDDVRVQCGVCNVCHGFYIDFGMDCITCSRSSGLTDNYSPKWDDDKHDDED